MHGAHFYLLSEFLSPIHNHRNDEYGGSDENKARFIIEITKKIREAIDNDMIISFDERKNSLVRPDIANVDQILLVFAAKKPDFSYYSHQDP